MKQLPMRRLVQAGLALIAVVPGTRGDDVTWTNASTNFKWNTTSPNWSTGLWNNANGDGAVFSSNAAGVIGTVSVTEAIQLRSILRNTSSGTYVIADGGGSLTFGNTGTSSLGPATIYVTGSGATILSIEAPIISTVGLTLQSQAVLNISNPNNNITGTLPVGNQGLRITFSRSFRGSSVSGAMNNEFR